MLCDEMLPDDMTLRAFLSSDQSAVIQLWQRCQLTRQWNDPFKDIQRKVALNDGRFIVIDYRGDIIGTAMFGYDGHRGSVFYLAVDPRYQGQGIGAALMCHIENELQRQGCPKINILVREENAAVVNFYHQSGYQQDKAMSLGKRLIADD